MTGTPSPNNSMTVRINRRDLAEMKVWCRKSSVAANVVKVVTTTDRPDGSSFSQKEWFLQIPDEKDATLFKLFWEGRE